MSMPVNRYTCTECTYQSFSTALWGQFMYELGSKQLHMRRTLGWCLSCAKLVPIEALPDASTLDALQARLRKAQEAVSFARAEAEQAQSWLRRLFRREPTLPVMLLIEAKAARGDLEEARQLADALRGRTQPRCLLCGGVDHMAVPVTTTSSAAEPPRGQSVPLGIAHPGCSGLLMRSSTGERASVNLRKRYYDRDGRLLRTE